MRTIFGVLYVIASIFLFLGAFHVMKVNFDPTLLGLALTVLGIGGQLLGKIWLDPKKDNTMNRIADAVEEMAKKIK